MGFSLERIAEVREVFGVIMLSTGVVAAGWGVARFGLMKCLIVGAFAGLASNLAFAWLAMQGSAWQAFATAGFSGTVLIAYMSSLTSLGFTATQYALFSSLYALPGKFLAAISGRIVEGAIAAANAGESEWLRSWFSGMSPTAFAKLSADRGIPAEAFAAGYMTFFIYSGVVGVAALVLAIVIMRKSPAHAKEAPA